MSPTPTESRIFATRYQREATRLEQLHANNIAPGQTKWVDAMKVVWDRMDKAGSPVKQSAILSKVINYVSSIKGEEKIAFPLAAYAGKRTAGLMLATLEFDNHPLVGPNEDGVSVVKFTVKVPRNGSSYIKVTPLAYISRHAIERMHERRNRPITHARATEMFAAVAALGFMIGFHEEHNAMCLDLGDVLAVGQMRGVAGQPDETGKRSYGSMYEVRSMLPVEELDPNDLRLRQGRVALAAVNEWVEGGRKNRRSFSDRVPVLAPRTETYTTKTAVMATS
jgi:hypothetical protein